MNLLLWQVYCKYILIHTCTKLTGPMQEQNGGIKTFHGRTSYICHAFELEHRHHSGLCRVAIPLRLWQGTHRETGRRRWGDRVQSGHQDGESNLQLDFIGSIQTLKTCLERKEENVATKTKSLKYEPSEFQKQLQNSQFPVQKMWLIWLYNRYSGDGHRFE